MPVVSVNESELLKLCQTDKETLMESLPALGVEIDGIKDDVWDLEINPNRCDLLSVEGIGRAIRGYIGKETGLPEYTVERSDVVTNVEMSVQEVRPFIVTAIIEDVQLTDETLKSLMDVQEKLHLTLGRKRRKVAIGVHDLDAVKPPFTYKAIKPDKISFVPLQRTHEMNLQEILDKHEKGKEYANILKDKTHYPVIVDSEDRVLSFPPIINGVLTQVTSETKNLFIDMTGTDESSLVKTLNILCTMFVERGATIRQTTVSYGGRENVYPDLSQRDMDIDIKEVRDMLGIPLDTDAIKNSLERMRYSVNISEEGTIDVKYPAYRHDILHPWDIIEDLAIGHGFHEFKGEIPKMVTTGSELPKKNIEKAATEVMIGLRFNETMNYPLSSPEDEYDMLELVQNNSHTIIENPVSKDNTCLRTWLLPSLIFNLHNNRNKPHPQRFFEIGDVVIDGCQHTKIAGVVCHSEAGFTEMKSIIDGLLDVLGIDHYLEDKRHDSFISGRCASIIKDEEEIGFFGEIHPQVLTNFELEYPVTAFELGIKKIK